MIIKTVGVACSALVIRLPLYVPPPGWTVCASRRMDFGFVIYLELREDKHIVYKN